MGKAIRTIKTIDRELFIEMLAGNLIRPASLEDVHGTHHTRPLFAHPNTGQTFVAINRNQIKGGI